MIKSNKLINICYYKYTLYFIVEWVGAIYDNSKRYVRKYKSHLI